MTPACHICGSTLGPFFDSASRTFLFCVEGARCHKRRAHREIGREAQVYRDTLRGAGILK